MADQEPLDLLSAVESGNVLLILKAQRRIIAEGLVTAADNTRPQYSNELNKLTKLICEEEERLQGLAIQMQAASKATAADDTFDASAI